MPAEISQASKGRTKHQCVRRSRTCEFLDIPEERDEQQTVFENYVSLHGGGLDQTSKNILKFFPSFLETLDSKC